MTLAAPRLDDRSFQDLVDDAKRLVQQRCPTWTDHNVSDPGVTLIETFAWMTDLTLFRLNRVPDRLYVKFLDLIGVTPFPPTPASVDVTFRLSAPQPEAITIAPGVQVATRRTETEEAIVFTVAEELSIVSCSVTGLLSHPAGSAPADRGGALQGDETFLCFSPTPQPDDALLVGLSAAAPANLVVLRFDCTIEGRGVDPRRPPLVWEAWTGADWSPCEVLRDETGGLNRAGDVELALPRGHCFSLLAKKNAGWLRCRVVAPVGDQPTYSASPRILGIRGHAIGGTTATVHADTVTAEILGTSAGTPGQRFALARGPVVRGAFRPRLEVSGAEGWEEWTAIESFAGAAGTDRVFVLDEASGEVALGPAVRAEDGTLDHHGAVPPKGSILRISAYQIGGGIVGNVSPHTVSVLKTAIPFVSWVDNPRAASGGVDGETVEQAKLRGSLAVRAADRAVTAEDHEQLARIAAPQLARVRCIPAGDGEAGLRVLVVPEVSDGPRGTLAFEQLLPSEETLRAVGEYLDERRMIGARISVGPPRYQAVTVTARLRARSAASARRLQVEAEEALNRCFHPLRGGPDGTGWPFGRPAHVGEVYAVLQRLPGVEFVEEAKLFRADAQTGKRGEPEQRIPLDPDTLVFSYRHAILAES